MESNLTTLDHVRREPLGDDGSINGYAIEKTTKYNFDNERTFGGINNKVVNDGDDGGCGGGCGSGDDYDYDDDADDDEDDDDDDDDDAVFFDCGIQLQIVLRTRGWCNFAQAEFHRAPCTYVILVW